LIILEVIYNAFDEERCKEVKMPPTEAIRSICRRKRAGIVFWAPSARGKPGSLFLNLLQNMEAELNVY